MAQLLIMDREESLRRLLESVFREKGHLVETVSNGQAAKKKIASQVYDLVIAGISIYDRGGMELLEYAREIRNPVTFIMMTAAPTLETAARVLNLGA